MGTRTSEASRGSPDFAAILTWFVPGAGHLYIGRPLLALIGFVVIEGLYFAGVRLSDGRLFEYLEPDLQGPFAGALAPEVGNLGALVWHMRTYGFGQGIPRPWPEHMQLGTWLTAISGFLNVCWMTRAHLDARRGRRQAARAAQRVSPDLLVLAGWAVPGLGHVLQKRVARGTAVFAVLVGLFLLGTVLAEGSNLDRERHFYYWAGQFLVGLPAVVGEIVHGSTRVTHAIPYVDSGLVMVCLAGLLNTLALLDVYGFAESEQRAERAGADAGRSSAEAPA